MAGKIKMPFHLRVFFALLLLCLILVGAVIIFQYQREKEFRAELFNMELQIYNNRIIDDMSHGENMDSVVGRISSPVPEIRLTLIDKDGEVVFDTSKKSPFPATNHNSRPEIILSRKNGSGFTMERHSESDHEDYFYSATLLDDGFVIRSAAPYTLSLKNFLRADYTFIWIMLAMTVTVSFGGYFVSRKISTSISRLNRFAEKASKGEQIYSDWAFPHDELGNIASNIVKLYVQRDRQHRQAIAQERDKTRLKKQLTNNINHELKTPVSSIIICADLLRDHVDLPEQDKHDFINRIYNNAQRLNTLLKDISTVTRMDDGGNMIEKELLDIYEIVNEVVADERMHTDMTINVSVKHKTIEGNKSLLESIFRNLIDNAIAYSGGTDIYIISDEKGNFIFRDNGIGIAQEHLPHIFERFYRIDKGRSRANGGTGLGLSIVKNAIKIHGGTISVRNDNGLRFDFNLNV